MAEAALQNARAAHSGAAAAEEFRNYIDGVWARSTSNRTFDNVNPATGDVISRVEIALDAEVEKAITTAEAGFRTWAAMSEL